MNERAQGNANIATIVERKSRYTVLFKNNDRRSRPLMDKLIGRLSPLPATARQSITFDRGFEFVSWRELDKGMSMQSWFCDPQAPWQKGSVENVNKRIRRRLPRHAAILSMTDPELRQINEILNATPRKCLEYRTPAEVFRECLLQMAG
jgi:IS30 family transposase